MSQRIAFCRSGSDLVEESQREWRSGDMEYGLIRRTVWRFVAATFFRGMGVGRELNLRPCALCLLVQGLGSSLKPKGESHVTSSLQALD